MSSFTRGHEVFWNRSIIAVQNLVRLVGLALLMGLVTFFLAFYALVPASYGPRTLKGLGLFKQELFARRFQNIPALWADQLSYQKNLLSGVDHELGLAGLVGLVVGLVVIVGGYLFFKRRGRNLIADDHIRGAQLMESEEFNQEMEDKLKLERREILADGGTPLSLKEMMGQPFEPTACRIKIPEDTLGRHIAVIGASGTGKSTLIKHKIEHAYGSGRKGIVLDFNGEIFSELGRPNDIILSLYDERSAYWDFCHEAIAPDKFAAFLVPETEGSNFWWKGPRRVLGDLFTHHREAQKLWQIIDDSQSEIKDHLSGGLAKRTIGSSSGQSSGVEGSLVLDLSFLEHLNYWPRHHGRTEPFSIYEWAQNDDPRWIYVLINEADSETASPLVQLWFNLAILGLIQRPARNQLPKMAIILDELSSIPKLELLSKVPDLSRKYGGEGLFGFQSPNQILSLYGTKAGSAILSGLQTKFIFNVPDPQEADGLASLLGKEEVRRKSASLSYSAVADKDRETLGENIILRHVVLGSEIMKLADGHCYLKVRGMNPLKTRLVKKRWKQTKPLYSDCAKHPPASASKAATGEHLKESPASMSESASLAPHGEPRPNSHSLDWF